MTISIGKRKIGPGEPVFMVAEAGINHNGDVNIAKKLVKKAAEVGADAIKFQTFRAEKLLSPESGSAEYIDRAVAKKETVYQLFKRLELDEKSHRELVSLAKESGIEFISTPFDPGSADMLEEIGVKVFKIASGDITDLPLLEHVARKDKPMIVSTGMANLGEIEEALEAIHSTGNRRVILLHCTSNYPPAPGDVNLRAMETLANVFQVPVGYSDHTSGSTVPLAAAALGACVIEKHFTLDRSLPGPDHSLSADPGEMKKIVEDIRSIEKALGSPLKKPVKAEGPMSEIARRSIQARVEIPKGTRISRKMLTIRRPSTGIAPKFLEDVVGKVARKSLKPGEPLTWTKLK